MAFWGICDFSQQQPLQINGGATAFALLGEIYNMNESAMQQGFAQHGIDFVQQLRGVFAIAWWDGKHLHLIRDHAGAKPLFYHLQNGKLVFSTTLRDLPTQLEIDDNSLREIFGLGPARSPGSGVFAGVRELLPGQVITFTPSGLQKHVWWQPESRPHEDDYPTTVNMVRELLTQAIEEQLHGDVCSLLSGGIDSSIVTAVAANKLGSLRTFSFDFAGNDEHFAANAFQPERDRPFVERMLALYPLEHEYLTCEQQDLFELLPAAMHARGLPGMADIDASLLYFSGEVAKRSAVALTGECADEVFSGYPWFLREELLHAGTFPWSRNMAARTALLNPELVHELKLDEYAQACYEESLAQVPRLAGESPADARQREVTWLTQRWFMQTLLSRMHHMGVAAGLTARSPFADKRVMEYLWNVPWAMKYHNGVVKGLLRDAFADLLPIELLQRKKSPFPKTYHPGYTNLLQTRLLEMMHDSGSPLAPLLNKQAVLQACKNPPSTTEPWFGQLMAGPQMLAYLIQVDCWLRDISRADSHPPLHNLSRSG
ncbi:MAG: asparagine synthetase B [Oscillospiraceae bacterium]|nr:asparagine synthetase B [Oscillospiraceae bacterium]